MLFDLRGRGRRRTVQVIYLTLAILMGGGLVFFGIGGDVSGGLFDAFSERGGGSGGSDRLEQQVKSLQRRVRTNPRDAQGWALLARARYQVAGQGDNYDQASGTFTGKGRRELAGVAQAWERHLALRPDPPNANVATLMVQAFGPLGLNDAAQGVTAAELVAEARPSASAYYQLALFAYAAKQTRKGDLAGQKAVELAPAAQRSQVKAQVDQAKRDGGFPKAGAEGQSQPQPQPAQ